MAKKSKTQRAKASAARSERKAKARIADDAVEGSPDAEKDVAAAETPKRRFFKKADKDSKASLSQPVKAQQKKPEKKVEKKQRFTFLKGVRAELKRVTWPTKQDVLRWSVVVVVALVFFGAYVAVLDNAVITPLLVAISGLGV